MPQEQKFQHISSSHTMGSDIEMLTAVKEEKEIHQQLQGAKYYTFFVTQIR
jgi:hypothetical protein